MQADLAALYDVIGSWWGSAPDSDLARIIQAAPESHLVEFVGANKDRRPRWSETMNASVRAKPGSGGLRPIWLKSWERDVDRAKAVRLLLYADAVVLSTDTIGIDWASTHSDTQKLREDLAWLCDTYPLVREGSLQYAYVSSHWKERLMAPFLVGDMPGPGQEEFPWQEEAPWEEEDKRLFRQMEDPLVGLWRHIRGIDADPFAFSPAQDWILRRAIGPTPVGSRVAALVDLAKAQLPVFSSVPRELVRLRSDEAAFEDWRRMLSASLGRVRGALGHDNDPEVLAGSLQHEMQEALAPIQRRLHRSLALQAIHRGGKGLVVAVLTGAGSAIFDDDPNLLALTGAAGAAVLGELGWELLRAAQSRDRDRMIWGTYASLF